MTTTKIQSPGFTLVELMVVLVILGIISVGTITAITSQSKVYHSEEDLIDAQMNARIAADRITFLLRMAGAGCSDSFGSKLDTGNLVTKGDVAANPTTSIFVSNNNSVGTPDQLTLVGAVKYVGYITSIPAANQIKLQCNEPPKIDATATKKYIFITPQDENRYRTISAISSTTTTTPTLTLSNSLDTDEKIELQAALTAGVVLDVCQVQAFTIRLVDHNNIRSLRIDGNIIASNTEMDVADNIQDLQFQYGIDTTTPNPNGQIDTWVDSPTDIARIRAVRFFILARTSKTDREYTDNKKYRLGRETAAHPDPSFYEVGPFNDHTHRYLLESTVAIRNRNF